MITQTHIINNIESEDSTKKSNLVEVIALGNISLSVFAEESQEGNKYHKFSLSKRYKDLQDNWQYTNNLNEYDSVNANVLLSKFISKYVIKEVIKNK